MIFTHPIRTLLGAASCVFASLLSAVPLSSRIDGDVNVLLSIRSLAESRAAWAGHPLAETFQDPELQGFFQPFLANEAELPDEESFTEVLENEFDLSVDELLALFPGQVSLAWFNLSELALGQSERAEIAILAEFSGSHERMTELMQVQFERNAAKHLERNPEAEHHLIEESFMGETLFIDEVFDGEKTYIEDGYALVDGIFILATPDTRLRSMVEALKEGPEAPLSQEANYLRAREQGGRGDLSVFVNLEAILPPLNAALLSKSMESGAAMLGLSSNSLDTALSLEALQAFYLDLDLIEEGVSARSGLLYREKAGLLRLLTYGDGPLPAARYVPKGVFSTTVTTFDFGAMLAELEGLLVMASPSMPILIDLQMQKIRTNTGVDIRAGLLENFGGDMVTLSILPEQAREASIPMQQEQVFLIHLNDSEAFSNVMEALKDLSPGVREQIQSRQFAGETIYTIQSMGTLGTPNEQMTTFSYVITRSNLIVSIGSGGLLQEVLTGMEQGGDGFWQEATTEALFEKISQTNAVSRSYVDLEQFLVPIFQSMVQASRMRGEASALDMQQIPRNLSLPFHMISELSEAEDGLFTRVLILQHEGSK
jgi:hypothetical protein